jgi:hypothetical protein
MAVLLLFGMAGCSSFKDTPETDAAFAAYEQAVKQSIAHKKGKISVRTETSDNVIENKESIGIIEYEYSIDSQNKVTYSRTDLTDGQKVAEYKGDGKEAYQLDLQSEKWIADEENEAMLSNDTNVMNSLQLFRIDSNFNYAKQFLQSVEMKEIAGEKVIVFTLKGDAISDMMATTDKTAISRIMSAQTRSYYVNEKGDLDRIEIQTVQDIKYKGKPGQLVINMTVTLEYE